jgi:hypothetical protein
MSGGSWGPGGQRMVMETPLARIVRQLNESTFDKIDRALVEIVFQQWPCTPAFSAIVSAL